jgi:hypothetical protein
MDHGALLEQFVFDQAKTVSYKWLSSELAIPAAGAKRCAARVRLSLPCLSCA